MTARRARVGRRPQGFTIIEVIVIVVILGILAAVIAPRLLSRIGQSRQGVAAANAASLTNQIRAVMIDNGGRLPAGATIEMLWERPGEVPAENWKGPYVENKDQLLDPWGKPYVLVYPGQKNVDFDLVSYGADGQPGGSDEDADVIKP